MKSSEWIVGACLFVVTVGYCSMSLGQSSGDEIGEDLILEGSDPYNDEYEKRAKSEFFVNPLADFETLTTSDTLRVRYEDLIDFDSQTLQKLQTARSLLNRVFASQDFYQAVIKHQYKGKKTFVQNRGYTNAQIYTLVQQGSEIYNSNSDNIMSLYLRYYFEDNTVYGYTYPNDKFIHVNQKFYRNFSPAKIAGNLTHEWLHKIGFDHDFDATNRRPYSVPYAIGYIVERLSKQLK